MNILIYAQHLSGVGHYMRCLQIARELGKNHPVYFIEGGKPVPHERDSNIHYVDIKKICRRHGELASFDGNESLEEVLNSRQQTLQRLCEDHSFDLLLIEHFPFSKWLLDNEITFLINACKTINPHCKVFSSVRDILYQTRHEHCTKIEYNQFVVNRLNTAFDALLIHADPAYIQINEFLYRANDIQIPVHYTGIVSQPYQTSEKALQEIKLLTQGKPYVVVSHGGGNDDIQLQRQVLDAWKTCQSTQEDIPLLVLFSGVESHTLSEDNSENNTRDKTQVNNGVISLPFNTDFIHWMKGAELTICCSGYNTCANILETNSKAILIPNTRMSDQVKRAELLSSLTGIEILNSPFSSIQLSSVILNMLETQQDTYTINLNGTQYVTEVVKQLHAL